MSTAASWPGEGAMVSVLFPLGRSKFEVLDDFGSAWAYECDSSGRALVQPEHVEQLVEEGCVLDVRR